MFSGQIQQKRQPMPVFYMQILEETYLETVESPVVGTLLNAVWRKYSYLWI